MIQIWKKKQALIAAVSRHESLQGLTKSKSHNARNIDDFCIQVGVVIGGLEH